MRRELYGSDHPRVSRALYNIGLVYFEQSQYQNALSYFRQALNIQKRNYSPDHSDTKAMQDNMALAIKKNRRKRIKNHLEILGDK